MEHQLFNSIVALLDSLDKSRTPTRFDFSDRDIVRVYYWAVIHDRPTCWACQRPNWPIHLRNRPLPSQPTLSRRLRSPSVVALLEAIDRRVLAPKEPGLFWMIDGKPLPIGGCSKDRQAGYGRAARSKAKGYKLHALVGCDGSIAAWRVAPMNKDERVMARRLLKGAPAEVVGYVAADGNYDSNDLHRVCDERGELQLVTPRRYGPGRGTGHRAQAAGRLRSIALTEAPLPGLGRRLLHDRSAIERQFGNLTNWGGGLNGLPAWVRTHRRVRLWVQAKLVLTQLKRNGDSSTYVA
jgi:DDE family transposase